jgi:hypothetical protein
MVIFGPVLDSTGSWGLGVVEADDEEELRAFAADDPVVTTGTASMEAGKMLAGFVRPRPANRASSSVSRTSNGLADDDRCSVFHAAPSRSHVKLTELALQRSIYPGSWSASGVSRTAGGMLLAWSVTEQVRGVSSGAGAWRAKG